MRILVSEPDGMSGSAVNSLCESNSLHVYNTNFRETLEIYCDTFKPEVIWVRLRHRIDAEIMDASPNLRCIVTPTTGLDHIDLAECERRGITVLSLKGETNFLRTIPATAEHTMGLMLALVRKIPAAAEHVREGGWDRYQFQGRDLERMPVCVVGQWGRIGQMVGGLCEQFGMHLCILEQAELVTVHVDLNETSRGMCNAKFFASMKPGSFFINTSRGEVVDESALLAALESGHLAGAALDVLCGEPEPKWPLIDYAREHPDRLIITPHIGGFTMESLERVECFMAEKLIHWIKEQG